MYHISTICQSKWRFWFNTASHQHKTKTRDVALSLANRDPRQYLWRTWIRKRSSRIPSDCLKISQITQADLKIHRRPCNGATIQKVRSCLGWHRILAQDIRNRQPSENRKVSESFEHRGVGCLEWLTTSMGHRSIWPSNAAWNKINYHIQCIARI